MLNDFQKFTCDNSSSNYFKLDSTFCNPNSIMSKILKANNTSIESSSESGRDFKPPPDRIRPSATGLVQRYTRNGIHDSFIN